jgi:hypothetical protein
MVEIQEHKTYFVSSRLRLPHGLGEVEPIGTFCHVTYVNINGLRGNGRMQHILNSYISKMVCCLFVTEEMDGVNLSVS